MEGSVDNQTLAQVARKLPYQDWFRIGLQHLKLPSLDLNNCDETTPNLYRTMFNCLNGWFIYHMEKRRQLMSAQREDISEGECAFESFKM